MRQFAIVPQIIIIYKNYITLDSLKADNFWFAKILRLVCEKKFGA
jgi:hypothetical protein